VQKTSTELEPSSSNTNTTSALEESQLHFLSCRRKFDSLRRQELKHRSIPERRQSPCYSSIAKRKSHLEDVPGSRACHAGKEPVSVSEQAAAAPHKHLKLGNTVKRV